MNTRDIGFAIRDALECGTVVPYREDEHGDLIESECGAVFIDSVDVSDPSNVILVDEIGRRFAIRIVAL